jgi:hypothetical protein
MSIHALDAFSQSIPYSSTNATEILLKVASPETQSNANKSLILIKKRPGHMTLEI